MALTKEKDMSNQQWEKDIKKTVGFSFEVLRDKLTPYMRTPLCVFPYFNNTQTENGALTSV